jgi:2'-5' RNA ligase
MTKSLLLLVILIMTPHCSYPEKKTALNESQAVTDEQGGSYSIWLMPEGDVLNKFSKLIIEISDEYNSPQYQPHVTLLGDLVGFAKEEVITKASELAESIKPFTITLTEVTYPTSYPNDLEAYYRSLYILAKRTEPLMKANELARKMFGREGDRPYNPHLSILYGPFPAETKEEIISKVGRDFNVDFEVSNIYVWSVKGLPYDVKPPNLGPPLKLDFFI